jgi:hypothetical protein
MENNKVFYSLEGHDSKYGICTHTCKSGVWEEFKNCCCGSDNDNEWYICGVSSGFPLCDENNEELIVYTNCFPKNDII